MGSTTFTSPSLDVSIKIPSLSSSSQQQRRQEQLGGSNSSSSSPVINPYSTSSSSQAGPTAVVDSPPASTAATRPTYNKGPEVFTSFFPEEKVDEEPVHLLAPSANTTQPDVSLDDDGHHAVAALAAAAAASETARKPEVSSSPSPSSFQATATGAETKSHTSPSTKASSASKTKGSSSSSSTKRSSDAQSAKPPATPVKSKPLYSSFFSPFSSSPGDEGMSVLEQTAKMAEEERKADEKAAEDSAYGRLLADLTTEPMTVKEDVAETPVGLPFEMPWAASAPSLEQMDKRMVM